MLKSVCWRLCLAGGNSERKREIEKSNGERVREREARNKELENVCSDMAC